jgi:hypothetical protein
MRDPERCNESRYDLVWLNQRLERLDPAEFETAYRVGAARHIDA